MVIVNVPSLAAVEDAGVKVINASTSKHPVEHPQPSLKIAFVPPLSISAGIATLSQSTPVVSKYPGSAGSLHTLYSLFKGTLHPLIFKSKVQSKAATAGYAVFTLYIASIKRAILLVTFRLLRSAMV